MKDFEIMFDDLKPEIQQELLDAAGMQDKKEANWDIIPIAFLPLGSSEEDGDGN